MFSIESVKLGPTMERPLKQRKTKKTPTTNSQDHVEQKFTDDDIIIFIKEAKDKGVDLLYYSKSKHPLAKYLSNFCILPRGLQVNDKSYSSVEAAFQVAKLDYLQKESKMKEEEIAALKKKFEKGKEFDKENPKSKGYVDTSVKTKGGRPFFRRNGLVLNMDEWNKNRVAVMRKLVQLRLDQDPKFQALIKACKEAGIELKHFERSGHFWGTSFDKAQNKWREHGDEDGNWHGKLLMELYNKVD